MELMVKEIVVFLKPIIPRNWNILSMWGNKKVFKPNALNITINILPEGYFDEDPEEEIFLGEVKGPLLFYPINLFTSEYLEVRRAAKKYPHACFSQIDLRLSYYWNWDREGTLIHEMAHIAAVRLHARRIGRKDRTLVGLNFEKDHSPLFRKAFRRLIIRTEKAYGKERTKDMRMHLKFYKKKGGKKRGADEDE